MTTPRRVAAGVLLAVLLAGCPWLVPASEAPDDAHVVFLTSPPCPAVVVKTQGDRFGILQPVQAMNLARGDMFVGPLRPGQVSLYFLPFPEQDLGPPVTVQVHGSGLVFADAQSLWRELCPGVDS